MDKYDGRTFRAERAWGGPNITVMSQAAVKLRWTDQPFRWHANTGEEIFTVLDGIVDMHVRDAAGAETIITLAAGELLHIRAGEVHVAHPRGQARILVVEQVGTA